MSDAPSLALSAERDPQLDEIVRGGLDGFNKAVFGRVDAQTLDVVVCDPENSEIIGGLLGHSSLGLFFLDLFYLPEHLRGAGHGTRVIALAEKEARRRGCTAAFVYTVTFQAPGFYERCGYRRLGEIACPPDGATRIFFWKPLDHASITPQCTAASASPSGPR
jgi:GNAT superfamily N-acetyltransferase